MEYRKYTDFLLTLTKEELKREMTGVVVDYANFSEQATPQELFDFEFGHPFGELSIQKVNYAKNFYWGEKKFSKMIEAFKKYKNGK